jgi:hypothetical protein
LGDTVTKQPHGLLAKIEAGALESRTPLADILRLCVALGGRAGSEQLRDWARHELEGYKNGETIPGYRIVAAPLYLHGSNLAYHNVKQQISIAQLPDFARDHYNGTVHITSGVAEIERLASSEDEVRLQAPGMPEIVAWLNHKADYGTAYHAMFYVVDKAQLHGIVDTIRTNLVALVAEMRAAGVDANAVPPAPVAEQAVQVVINGAKRSPININTALATGNGDASAEQQQTPETTPRMPGWIRGPWGLVVGLATIAAGYAGFAVGLDWPPF